MNRALPELLLETWCSGVKCSTETWSRESRGLICSAELSWDICSDEFCLTICSVKFCWTICSAELCREVCSVEFDLGICSTLFFWEVRLAEFCRELCSAEFCQAMCSAEFDRGICSAEFCREMSSESCFEICSCLSPREKWSGESCVKLRLYSSKICSCLSPREKWSDESDSDVCFGEPCWDSSVELWRKFSWEVGTAGDSDIGKDLDFKSWVGVSCVSSRGGGEGDSSTFILKTIFFIFFLFFYPLIKKKYI